MKIGVDVRKKYFFAVLLISLVVAGIAGVAAYTAAGTGGTPSTFGHSVDEIDWSQSIKGTLQLDGDYAGSNRIQFRNTISNPSAPYSGGHQWEIYPSGGSDGGLDFYDRTAPRTTLSLRNNGRVGVGTNNPGASLDVRGNAFIGDGATSEQNIQLNAGTNPVIRLQRGGTNIYALLGNYDTTDGLSFYSYQATVPGTKLELTKEGNVGIGTITPGAKLDVNGNVKATQFCLGDSPCISSWPTGGAATTTTGGDVNVGGVGSAGTLKIYGSAAAGDGTYGIISKPDNNVLDISSGQGTASADNIVQINSNLRPRYDNLHDLGAASNRWKSLSVGTGGGTFAGSIVAGGIISAGTFYASAPAGLPRSLIFYDSANPATKHNFLIAEQLVDDALTITPSTEVGGLGFVSQTAAFTVYSNGNVGIGTGDSVPSAKLDVNGYIKVGGNYISSMPSGFKGAPTGTQICDKTKGREIGGSFGTTGGAYVATPDECLNKPCSLYFYDDGGRTAQAFYYQDSPVTNPDSIYSDPLIKGRWVSYRDCVGGGAACGNEVGAKSGTYDSGAAIDRIIMRLGSDASTYLYNDGSPYPGWRVVNQIGDTAHLRVCAVDEFGKTPAATTPVQIVSSTTTTQEKATATTTTTAPTPTTTPTVDSLGPWSNSALVAGCDEFGENCNAYSADGCDADAVNPYACKADEAISCLDRALNSGVEQERSVTCVK